MYKKLMFLVVLGLLLSPLAKAQTVELMGFGDGVGLYDKSGKQLYTCMPDNSCVGLDDKVYTRAELGVGPVIPLTVVSPILPQNTPQTVYVPVYIPSNTGAGIMSQDNSQPTQPNNQATSTSASTLVPEPAPKATYDYNGSKWFVGETYTVAGPITYTNKYRLIYGGQIVGWKKTGLETRKYIQDGHVIKIENTGLVSTLYSYEDRPIDDSGWFLGEIPHDTEIAELLGQ